MLKGYGPLGRGLWIWGMVLGTAFFFWWADDSIAEQESWRTCAPWHPSALFTFQGSLILVPGWLWQDMHQGNESTRRADIALPTTLWPGRRPGSSNMVWFGSYFILTGLQPTWNGENTAASRLPCGYRLLIVVMIMMLITNVIFVSLFTYLDLQILCEMNTIFGSIFLSSLLRGHRHKWQRWDADSSCPTPESGSQPLCLGPHPSSECFNGFPNICGVKSKCTSFLLRLYALAKLLFRSCAHCAFYNFQAFECVVPLPTGSLPRYSLLWARCLHLSCSQTPCPSTYLSIFSLSLVLCPI